MLKTVNSNDSIEVRLRIDKFPYKWKLFEVVPSGTVQIGEGTHDIAHPIGKVTANTTRVLIWSFVVVSQDPDTNVTVVGEAIANGAVVAAIESPLTVKKPTTSKFFQFELTGKA